MLLPPANEVWGKIIFLEACVKNSVHRGDLLVRSPPWQGGTPWQGDLPRKEAPLEGGTPLQKEAPPGRRHPPPEGGVPPERGSPWKGGTPLEGGPPYGYCCGRYASYWNAFLLSSVNTPLRSVYTYRLRHHQSLTLCQW